MGQIINYFNKLIPPSKNNCSRIVFSEQTAEGIFFIVLLPVGERLC